LREFATAYVRRLTSAGPDTQTKYVRQLTSLNDWLAEIKRTAPTLENVTSDDDWICLQRSKSCMWPRLRAQMIKVCPSCRKRDFQRCRRGTVGHDVWIQAVGRTLKARGLGSLTVERQAKTRSEPRVEAGDLRCVRPVPGSGH